MSTDRKGMTRSLTAAIVAGVAVFGAVYLLYASTSLQESHESAVAHDIKATQNPKT